MLLSLLTACVSYSNNLQFVSNSFASDGHTVNSPGAGNNAQLCNTGDSRHEAKDNPSQGLNPENIAFLNWNLYKGNGDGWQKDLSSFAQSHDLMTIQEALLDEELAGLLEDHEFDWVMNAAFHLDGLAAGVMTVANSSAVHSCGFIVSEPLIRIPKSALVSYYAIDGTDAKLLVANIHGINFTIGVDDYRNQMELLYGAIKHHNGPMIVAGDFNSWSDDRMGEVLHLVEKLSLSEIEYPVNNKTHVFGNAIDHVFYRQLESVSNHVWQVSSSDHNPISVNFRYRETVFKG